MVRKTMIIVILFIGETPATLYGSYSSTMSPLSQPLSHTGNTPRTGSSLQALGPDDDDMISRASIVSIGSRDRSGDSDQQDQSGMSFADSSRSDETQAGFSQRRFNDCVRLMSCPRPGEPFGQRRNRVLFCVCMISAVGAGLTAVTWYLRSKLT